MKIPKKVAGTFFLLLISMATFAQVQGEFEPSTHTGRGGRKQVDTTLAPIKAEAGRIAGHCTLVAGNGNLIDSPCPVTLLVLTDDTGKEIRRTRTGTKGDFIFEAQQNIGYKIVPEAKSIEAVSPSSIYHSGEQINLKLKLK